LIIDSISWASIGIPDFSFSPRPAPAGSTG
jgi:hypothetical protein